MECEYNKEDVDNAGGFYLFINVLVMAILLWVCSNKLSEQAKAIKSIQDKLGIESELKDK